MTFSNRVAPGLWALTLIPLVASGDPKVDPNRSPAVTLTVAAIGGLCTNDLRIEDAGQAIRPEFCYPLAARGAFAAPLGPQEFSNRGNAAPPLIVLLDLLNTNFAERGYGWNDIARALRGRAQGSEFYIYLVTKEAKLYPVRGIPAAGAAPSAPMDGAQLAGELDQALHTVSRLRPWDLQVNDEARTQATLAVLRELAAQVGHMSGRKNVLWVSHGASAQPKGADGLTRNYTEQFQSVAADLAQEDIAVYAVDQQARRLGWKR